MLIFVTNFRQGFLSPNSPETTLPGVINCLLVIDDSEHCSALLQLYQYCSSQLVITLSPEPPNFSMIKLTGNFIIFINNQTLAGVRIMQPWTDISVVSIFSCNSPKQIITFTKQMIQAIMFLAAISKFGAELFGMKCCISFKVKDSALFCVYSSWTICLFRHVKKYKSTQALLKWIYYGSVTRRSHLIFTFVNSTNRFL